MMMNIILRCLPNVVAQVNIGWLIDLPVADIQEYESVRKVELVLRTDMDGIYDPFNDDKSPEVEACIISHTICITTTWLHPHCVWP